MLQQELAAEELRLAVQVFASVYGPNIAHEKTPELMQAAKDKIDMVSKFDRYGWYPGDTPEARARNIVKNAARIFQALRDTGILEKFDRKATEIHNRLQ